MSTFLLLELWGGAAGAQDRLVAPELMQAAQTHGVVRVIVEVASVLAVPEGQLASPAAVATQRRNIRSSQGTVLQGLRGTSHRVGHQFETVPFLAMEASPDALRMLETLRGVLVRVLPDRLSRPTDAESTPLVGAPAAWASGFDGTGTVIAVLDTGVDGNHPFLSGKVLEEACFSSTVSGQTATLWPNGQEVQFGPGAGAPCSLAGCVHGTHVAGIAAGNGDQAGQSFSGIARGASLMAVQVFSKFTQTSDCGFVTFPPCALSWTSDLMAGLERVFSLSAVHNFAAVNMSLGGDTFTSPCDTNPLKPLIDNLRSVGIATVIAAGNNGLAFAISEPACISTAVSVGSTTKADSISSFSNIAPFLSLLAPGSSITSSVPGGGYAVFSGTSMATAHVAGAFAILHEVARAATVSDLLGALQTTGKTIFSTTGIFRPRIQIAEALSVVATAPLVFPNISLGLALSQHTAVPGDLVQVSVTGSNSGGAGVVDLYFVILVPPATSSLLGCPGGDAVAFLAAAFSKILVPCVSTAPIQSFEPLYSGVLLPAGMPLTTAPDFYSLVWPPGIPGGTYTFAIFTTPAMAFPDGTINVNGFAADTLQASRQRPIPPLP